MTNQNITTLQQKVLEILVKDTDEKQSITGFNLMKRVGIGVFGKSTIPGADMRRIIHALRIKGYPICANNRGYFYAHSQHSLSKFIVKLSRRVQSQEEVIKGLQGSFNNVGSLKSDLNIKAPIYVRTDTGTVAKIMVPIDGSGHPIVPEGVNVL